MRTQYSHGKQSVAAVWWPTCGRVLEQLLELGRGEGGACEGHEHAQLLQLGLDVGLLHEAKESAGGNPLGRAIRRAFQQIDDHLCPAETQGQTETSQVWGPLVK